MRSTTNAVRLLAGKEDSPLGTLLRFIREEGIVTLYFGRTIGVLVGARCGNCRLCLDLLIPTTTLYIRNIPLTLLLLPK